MSWLLPTAKPVIMGSTREIREGQTVKAKRTSYFRAYYHLVRKPKGYKTAVKSKEAIARDAARRKQRYHEDLDRYRAEARMRYWKNRERYKEANRLRQAAKRQAAKAGS